MSEKIEQTIDQYPLSEWTINIQANLIVHQMRESFINCFEDVDEIGREAIATIFNEKTAVFLNANEYLSNKAEQDFEEKYCQGGRTNLAKRSAGLISLTCVYVADALRFVRESPPNGNAFYYICRASMFAGLVMGQDEGWKFGDLFNREQKSNAAKLQSEQRYGEERRRVFALWDSGRWNIPPKAAEDIHQEAREEGQPFSVGVQKITEWIRTYIKSK